MIFLKGSDI